jgi:hypothetical protein
VGEAAAAYDGGSIPTGLLAGGPDGLATDRHPEMAGRGMQPGTGKG